MEAALATGRGTNRRLTVCLTGGIGSGKSSVARLFAERGIEVIDADELAHDLTRSGGAAMTSVTRGAAPRSTSVR